MQDTGIDVKYGFLGRRGRGGGGRNTSDFDKGVYLCKIFKVINKHETEYVPPPREKKNLDPRITIGVCSSICEISAGSTRVPLYTCSSYRQINPLFN